ncbi:MAG TPA: hypothetical protein VMB02_02985 [Candidatus Aquilonibacter sp.]|nr:hypothetical protein [Candidatus Aquilonibacter sp.]
MTDAMIRQSIVDEEHLKILSIGYMVSAAISAVFSLFGLMYAAMGTVVTEAMKRAPELATNPNSAPPEFIGWIFGALGVGFFLLSITLAGLKLGVALCLRKRKGRVFCMVVGVIECFGVPYGTLLGIFTFIVLGRETVTRLFEANTISAPPA